MPSGSAVRYLILSLAVAAISLLLGSAPAAASPAALNLNISNNACGCTNLLGFPDGKFVLSNSFETVSVTFSFGRIRFFTCDPMGNCHYRFGSGGSIELVINPGTANSVTYTGEFVSAGETITSCRKDPSQPAVPSIGVDGTFRLNGFDGTGSIAAFDSCVHPAGLDQAGLSFSGTPTPEPSSLLLFAIGLLGFVAVSAHRRKRILD